MTTITIWILLTVSYGGSSYGTATVIDRFATREDCMAAADQVRSLSVRPVCLSARVVR